MNLHSVRNGLSKINLDDLRLNHENSQDPGDRQIKILFKNVFKYKYAVRTLESIELCVYDISLLKNTQLYNNHSDSFYLDIPVAEKIIALSKRIIDGATAIGEFIEHYLFNNERQDLVRILLPKADDFPDLAVHLNELKKAISIPIRHPDILGEVNILSSEPGSIWLIVGLVTQRALKLISELSWSAVVIEKKRQEGRLLEQQVRSLELENDLKEAVVKAQKAKIEQAINMEAEGIAHRLEINADNEYLSTLRMSILTFEGLFGKGAEVRPGLNVPEDVAQHFPKMEEKALIESKIKQITERTNP